LRGLDAGDRQTAGVEQADLDEHARLIPADVLVIQFITAEIDNCDDGTSTYLPVGRTPGSIQSISTSCVNETTNSSTGRSAPTVCEIRTSLKSARAFRDELMFSLKINMID